MSWIEVKARYSPPPADLSPAIDIFREHGIENTLESGDTLVGCMVDVEGAYERVDALKAALKAHGANDVTAEMLQEENWEEAWKQFFKPRRIGKRFVIRPTWEPFPAEPEDRVIVLDPGQAFGTGDHPTTRMCLELMEAVDLDGRRVADVGCGSGILAVAACLLGAREVDAVDIDPLAVEVAKENAALNEVSFRAVAGAGVSALAPEAPTVDPKEPVAQDETPLTEGQRHAPVGAALAVEPYDLVLSNIISATLIRIAHDVADVVAPNGGWIVSGIISANWPDVQAAAEGADFTLADKREEDGWVAARFHHARVGE